jgi:hypothetical protein
VSEDAEPTDGGRGTDPTNEARDGQTVDGARDVEPTNGTGSAEVVGRSEDDAGASGNGAVAGSESVSERARQQSTDGLGRYLRLATHALQAGLIGLTVYAVVAETFGSLVNVGIPLAIALLPEYLRRRTSVRLHPGLELWIATAAVLHVGGTLGAYEALGWYDQLAHAVSGVLVAGVGYAIVRAVDDQYESVVIPPNLRFVFILVFTMAVGALWEVGEFGLSGAASLLGGEPLLTQYGLDDVVLDLVFDALGAVLVATVGTRYFAGVRSALARRLGDDAPTSRGDADDGTAPE